MVNTIRQLQDLKEWAQDSTRYERRLNFRLAQKPYNWEEGNWWDLDDESVGNTKILEDFEITDEMRRRPNAEGGVQQLVQPGPGRQGYQGEDIKFGSGTDTSAMDNPKYYKTVRAELNKIKKQRHKVEFFDWKEGDDWYKALQKRLGGMNREHMNKLLN